LRFFLDFTWFCCFCRKEKFDENMEGKQSNPAQQDSSAQLHSVAQSRKGREKKKKRKVGRPI